MLKKITTIIFILLTLPAFSQSCDPDTTITEPGIYPDQLAAAQAGSPYEFTIQILSLEDTLVNFQGQQITANIDSVKMDSVVGLPAGFTHQCEPANCLFDYTAVGCIKLSGNPSLADTGIYPLSIYTTAYARWNVIRLPVADTITDYVLVIAKTVTSVEEAKNDVIVYPNPVTGSRISVSYNTKIEEVQLMGLEGIVVRELSGVKSSTFNLSTSGLPKGMYILNLYTERGLVVKKIIL